MGWIGFSGMRERRQKRERPETHTRGREFLHKFAILLLEIRRTGGNEGGRSNADYRIQDARMPAVPGFRQEGGQFVQRVLAVRCWRTSPTVSALTSVPDMTPCSLPQLEARGWRAADRSQGSAQKSILWIRGDLIGFFLNHKI